MKYSKYFGLITRNKGQLNLSVSQFQRLMNIVSIEGVISGLERARETYKGTNSFYKYDTLIFKQSTILSDLTGNLEPDKLLEEMHSLE